MRIAMRAGWIRRAQHLALVGLLALGGCWFDDGGGSSPPPPPPAAPTLQSIEITPAQPSVAAGTSTQLAATAIYSDTSHADVTGQVAWASSDASVATVGASTGRAVGVKAGTATLSATLNGVSGSTTFTVTRATVTSIAITPAAPSVAAGTAQQLVATGTFTRLDTQDLSADVAWSSSDTAVATVSAGGLATGVVMGQSTITAKCSVASTCGTASGTTTLKVTAAALVSLAVTPAQPSIALGTTQQFVATGTYSDHSTQNLSAQVTWTSSAAGVATIASGGLATSVATGTTNVTATLGAVGSAAVPLTVTPATLTSIAITPAAPSIVAGLTQPLTATGTYSDHTTQNLTARSTPR